MRCALLDGADQLCVSHQHQSSTLQSAGSKLTVKHAFSMHDLLYMIMVLVLVLASQLGVGACLRAKLTLNHHQKTTEDSPLSDMHVIAHDAQFVTLWPTAF